MKRNPKSILVRLLRLILIAGLTYVAYALVRLFFVHDRLNAFELYSACFFSGVFVWGLSEDLSKAKARKQKEEFKSKGE